MADFNPLEITTISAQDVDELVLGGIKFIEEKGRRFDSRSGMGFEVEKICYTLTNSRNRVLNIRSPISFQYLVRELLVYLRGSLDVEAGLSKASSYWRKLADPAGRLNSNYGYYVFHEKYEEKTQYQWLKETLKQNMMSRRALVNVNQIYHKKIDGLDFPCSISSQYYIRDGYLHCLVNSRSVDVNWGLPYDIGFWSFVCELLCVDLKESENMDIELGSTTLFCAFSQIYDKTSTISDAVVGLSGQKRLFDLEFPAITDASKIVRDINEGTSDSKFFLWLNSVANIEI